MKRICGWLVVLTAVLSAVDASAWEQTMTCTTDGPFVCRAGEIPKPVMWPSRCSSYYVNENGTDQFPNAGGEYNADLLAAIEDSFSPWNDDDTSDVKIVMAGMTNEERAEYAPDREKGGNANILVFRDGEWPFSTRTAFAITSVTFNPENGIIADADIELNSANHQFTISESANVDVDIRNTLTHEAGHFIGLDHSDIRDATMFGRAPNGETSKRTLHPDDIEAVSTVYPLTGQDDICAPQNDFFDRPSDDDGGCCATVRHKAPVKWILVLGIVALFLRRRFDFLS